jgi:hypothetical protein
MSSPRRPSSARGRPSARRLPASVYWRRRLFVLAIAGSLVFMIASLLSGGGSESDDAPVAQQAGAGVEATSAAPGADGAAKAATKAGKTGKKGKKRKKGKQAVPLPPPTPTLAAPQGPCTPADVRVTPAIAAGAVAGGDVPVTLSLQTVQSEACTWQVSHASVVVRIADGSKEIWTTRHCRKSVPTQDVVVRRAVPTVVTLTWRDARESEEDCRRGHWVGAGDYSIAAAALGGEPVATSFELGAPARETITVTPEPKPTKTPKKPRN